MLIKTLRMEKKLTQLELAKKLNVGQSAVGNWEAGKRQPKLATLKKLAELFECSIEELID